MFHSTTHRPERNRDGVPAAAAGLVAWARERGLAGGQWLGYQRDDPEIVPLERCRHDVGGELPDAAAVEPDVNVAVFPAITVAELAIDRIGAVAPQRRVSG